MSIDALAPLEPDELLASRAYRELSHAIMTGRLTPGTRLSVPELAARLGISRSPVREAVQRLTYEGLAEDRGRRGAVVTRLEASDFLSLLEVRQLLEGFAARKAAVNATAQDVSRLQDAVRRHRERIDAGVIDEAAHVEFDLEFHGLVRDLAGNEDLTAILGRMQGRAHLSYVTLWREPLGPEHAVGEHDAIVDAVAGGDPAAAEAAAVAHIEAVRHRYEERLAEEVPG